MRRPFLAVPTIALWLIACSLAPPAPLLEELEGAGTASSERPRWPAAPAEARIVYLGAISGEAGFGARRSLWRRIASVLSGDPGQRFVRPAAVCLQGPRLAVADPGAGAVHLLDLGQRRWHTIRRTPAGSLGSPVGVAFLPDGRLVVSDSLQGALWLYGVGGAALGRFGAAALNRPTGLAFDPVHARLWVAETEQHRLRAFDLDGRELMRVGGRGSQPGWFNFPTWLAADREGGLWVTDSLNFRLQRFDGSGRLDRHFGVAGDRAGEFARPRGLAVDAAGRMFAVDALFDSVQIFDPAGRLLLVFGGRGTEPGRLWLPSDVALDHRGHVYVVDSYNRRVQIFSYHPPGAP